MKQLIICFALCGSLMNAMDDAAAQRAQEAKDEKKSEYAVVVQEMLRILTPRCEQMVKELEKKVIEANGKYDEFLVQDFRELWTQEEYAPALKMFLDKKLLDPKTAWTTCIKHFRYEDELVLPCTMLGEAVDSNAYENVKILLEHGADVNALSNIDMTISRRTQTKFTPIYIAAINWHEKILELLFKHNANANISSKGCAPALPLGAAIFGYLNPSNFMNHKAFGDGDNIQQETVKNNFLRIIKVLLDNNARPTQEDSEFPNFPEANCPLAVVKAYNEKHNRSAALLEELLITKVSQTEREQVDESLKRMSLSLDASHLRPQELPKPMRRSESLPSAAIMSSRSYTDTTISGPYE